MKPTRPNPLAGTSRRAGYGAGPSTGRIPLDALAAGAPAGFYVLQTAILDAVPGAALVASNVPPEIAAAVYAVDAGVAGAVDAVRAYAAAHGRPHTSERVQQRIDDMRRFLGGRLPGETERRRAMIERPAEIARAFEDADAEGSRTYTVTFDGTASAAYVLCTLSSLRAAEAAVYAGASARLSHPEEAGEDGASLARFLVVVRENGEHRATLTGAGLVRRRLGFAPHVGPLRLGR